MDDYELRLATHHTDNPEKSCENCINALECIDDGFSVPDDRTCDEFSE